MSDLEEKRVAFIEYHDKLMDDVRCRKPLPKPRVALQELEALFDLEWQEDWLKLFIFYNCANQSRPSKTFGKLIELRALCKKSDREAEFHRFFDEVNGIMYPFSLTFHGYISTFGSQDTEIIARSMDDLLRPLEKMGYPFFLYAGALLGLVRDGSFIGHDDDVDLAIYLGECSDEEAARKWQEYKIRLCEAGLVAAGSTSNNPAVFKLLNDTGIAVDLFPAWAAQSRFSVYPYSFHAIAADDIFPLITDMPRTKAMFGSYPISLPTAPEVLLAESYGPNWTVPDPLFRFGWRHAQRQFHLICNQSYC